MTDKMQNKFLKYHSGETLIEVMLAVSILVLILMPASAMYISGTRNIANNRNNLIGTMLAQEGLEMVRGIVYGNLISFNEKTVCWNSLPVDSAGDSVTVDNCNEASNKIDAGSYLIDDDGFILKNKPLDDAALSDGGYELKLNDKNFYNYASGTSTGFFREIVIEYPLANDETNAKAMFLASRVFYRVGGKVQKIVLTDFLSQYEK